MKTHALITPWRVTNGLPTLVAWCGSTVDGFVAKEPEAVDCLLCIRAMRRAQQDLNASVPRLREEDAR